MESNSRLHMKSLCQHYILDSSISYRVVYKKNQNLLSKMTPKYLQRESRSSSKKYLCSRFVEFTVKTGKSYSRINKCINYWK